MGSSEHAEVVLEERGPDEPGYQWFWRKVVRFRGGEVQVATECRYTAAETEWRAVHHVNL